MRLLGIVFLLLYGAVNAAQENPEHWAVARLLCETESAYRIEVEAIGAVDTVFLALDNGEALVWYVEAEKRARFDIALSLTSVSLSVYANGGAFFADTLLLSKTSPCESPQGFENLLRERLFAIEREH